MHMVANTIEARVALALRDIGLAFVPVHSVRDALADGRLVTVLDEHVHSCGIFHLLWPSAATCYRNCACSSTSSAHAWKPCPRRSIHSMPGPQ